ncbi:hypothetical protein [Pseudomonas citronellolis]|uniref:hypothetical protein n=1 Tax=Pseudomonas citronellolis TaxID=53408 RepID=UPI003C2F1D8B
MSTQTIRIYKTILAAGLLLTSGACHSDEIKNTTIRSTQKTISKPKVSWAGCYKQKSYLCTSPEDGSNCEDKFNDTLKITYKDPSYAVQLNSTQANQNICSFNFEMTESNGQLVHGTEFGRILIFLKGNTIEISSKGIDPTALGLGICGNHADINELTYSLANKSDNDSDCAKMESGQ